ncbi:MAG TPA: cytochrome c biogenesis protein ResB [Pseudogracilibacillus sp.]|nr:cytochrome c biogenesis protein ResB [Pseudogracilibacillus sp.]
MNKLKCECGHFNPEGTILCESCGKPIKENQHLDGNDKTKLLNMRYDGSARRSLTYNRTFVDKVWTFFSSVRNGVILIVIALIASGLGTIFPQAMYIPAEAENRDPAVFYEDWYGLPGKIYYQLGLHELYSSWWYMVLIALIGISLVICSLDRFIPLYRALKIQKPKRHRTFLSRQRLFSETANVSKEETEKIIDNFKKQRYKILEEDGQFLAEKNRFSRWGPYVNHIGLIIILIAGILRMTPFMFLDDYVWVREGERTVIPGTDGQYYIENKKFHLEYYDLEDERYREAMERTGELVVKNYQTDAIIYKVKSETITGQEPELEVLTEASSQMNKPIKFDGYTLYQSGYQDDEFASMTFDVVALEDEGTSLGKVTVDLMNPEERYELENGTIVELADYFPDYELNDGVPKTKSNFPKNPAFVFNVYPEGSDKKETSFVGIGRNIDATGENEYALKIDINEIDMLYVSGLTLRKDYTLPFFIVGATIFMIGVIQGMYWQHRRVWINEKDGALLLAAHTNKNWFGLKKDIEKAINGTGVHMVIDQQDEEEKEQEKVEKKEQDA